MGVYEGDGEIEGKRSGYETVTILAKGRGCGQTGHRTTGREEPGGMHSRVLRQRDLISSRKRDEGSKGGLLIYTKTMSRVDDSTEDASVLTSLMKSIGTS